MNMTRKICTSIVCIFIFLLSFCLISCKTKEPIEITLGSFDTNMTIGEERTILFQTSFGTATASFESSDESILSVDENGLVKALKEGNVNVKVTVTASDDTVKEFTLEIKIVSLAHSIEYILNGADGTDLPKTYKENEKTEFSAPSKPGHKFLGWSLNAASSEYVLDTEGLKEDIVLYANFEKISYTISYLGLYEGSTSCYYGDEIVLEDAQVEGYNFLGWSYEEGSKEYVTKLNITADVNLYGNFEKQKFTVSFSGVDKPQYVADYNESVTLEPFTKEGYTFLGWSYEEGSTDYISSIIVKNDVVIYANFEIIKYTITFEGIDKGPIIVNSGDKYTVEEVSKEGYKFLGWKLSQETDYITEIVVVEDITLIALFEEIQYKVTFSGIDKDELIVKYNEEVELTSQSIEGYNFLGWTITEQSTEYITKLIVTADITVYANFEKKSFTVTYSGVDKVSSSVLYNESIDLEAANKEGYKFLGWSLAESSNKYVTNITITADVTVYANFVKSYKITYDANGGEMPDVIITEYIEGESSELPKPTNGKNDFVGWTVEEDGDDYLFNTSDLSGDVKLYANWGVPTLKVGEGQKYATLAEALKDAKAKEKIVLVAGTYEGAVITKSVIIEGPNASINPNTASRKAEAIFTTDLIFATNDITINGVKIVGNARFITQQGEDLANLTVKYCVSEGSTVNVGTTSDTAPFHFGNESGKIVKNIVIEKCRIEALTSGRPMILYGAQIQDIIIKDSVFLGGFYNYNDGIKFDELTDFGVKGNVVITGNTFENYAQYVIWLRKYGAGNYTIENNRFTKIGQTNDRHAMVTFVSSTVLPTENIEINVKYNKFVQGYMLFRMDGSGELLLDNNTKININYNVMENCDGKYYISNLMGSVKINAQYNYFGVTTPAASKMLGVHSYSNHYENSTSVLSKGEVENNPYSIEYDLDGGQWYAKVYTRQEIVANLLADLSEYYNATVTESNVNDVSELASVKMYDFFTNAKYSAKWGWLKDYLIYCRTNDENRADGASYLKNTADSMSNAYWRYEVKGFLNGIEISSWPYSANYANEEFTEYFKSVVPLGDVDKYPTTYFEGKETVLTAPVREGYVFQGWKDQNKEVYSNIAFNVSGDLKLKAVWKEAIKPTDFVVNNITENIIRYDELQLKWTFTPANTYNQNVGFSSSDENIFTVSKNGLITAISEGEAVLTVTVDADSSLSIQYLITVYCPGYVDVAYETVPYVSVNEVIQLNAKICGAKQGKIVWSSNDETIATVDELGKVTGLKAGYVEIVAKIKGTSTYTEMGVTVYKNVNELDDVVKYVLSLMNGSSLYTNAVSYNDSGKAFYYPIYRGASLFLFEDLNINKNYMRTDRPKLSTDVAYICIHDTGNFSAGADAEANISYFQGAETSIHYTTGNDGVFQGVDLGDRAAHAGDGTFRAYSLDKTNVLVQEGTPVITMIDGFFAINGTKTTCRPCLESGAPDPTNYKTEQITYSGIRCVAGTDGYYYLGKTYYNATYNQIANYGGNASSIGIESCVNAGTDYYLTMQRTAKLVAQLMKQFDLTINDVKMHNFFSGKNCAQLMKNNSRYELSYIEDGFKYEDTLWGEFLELCQIEYDMLEYSDYTFKFISENTELLDNTGRIIKHNTTPTCVKYTIEITSKTTQVTTTIESSVIIPGTFGFE